MASRILKYRNRVALMAGAVVPFAVGAVLVPFRVTFTNAAAALVMVGVIVAVAVMGNRIAGIVASASSAIAG